MRKKDYLQFITIVILSLIAIALKVWWLAFIFDYIIIRQSCASDKAQTEIVELLNALEKWDIDAVRSQSEFLIIRHRARRALKHLNGKRFDENDE